MKRIMWVALGVSAVVLLAGFGGFHGHGGPFGEDPAKLKRFINFRVNSALDDLNATADQRAKVNALKDDLFSEAMKLHSGQAAAKQELVSQWDSANPDANRVHAVVDERIDAVRAFAHRVADTALKLHDILTPQQRAELRSELPNHP